MGPDWHRVTPMRRAALVLGLLVAVAILALGRLAQPDPAPVRPAAPGPVEHAEHAEPTPPPGSPAERAAVAFMTAYTDRPTVAGRDSWDRRMADLTTPALAEGLHWAEAERLPDGEVTGSEVLEVADAAVAVRVDLDNGESWAVTVEAVQAGWRASDVRPLR